MAEAFDSVALPGLAVPQWSEQAGTDDLFHSLLQQHSRLAFRVAYSVLRNAPDAEDVVQETFLRIYRSRAWQRMEDEKAFIARVAWRLAVDQAKKNRVVAARYTATLCTLRYPGVHSSYLRKGIWAWLTAQRRSMMPSVRSLAGVCYFA